MKTEKTKQTDKLYRLKNKEKIKADMARRYKLPSYRRMLDNNRYKRLYGITIEQYDKMLKHQDYKCKICKKDERARQSNKIKKLAVDHCHKTLEVRGLLCHSCNVRLSFIDNYNKEIGEYLKWKIIKE